MKSKKKHELVLQANPYYKRLVQIEQIFFIQNKKRFLEYIASDKYDSNQTKRFYLAHGFFLMNPNTTLTYDERKATIETLQSYIYDKLNKNDKHFRWIADMPDGKNHLHQVNRPVRILIDENNGHMLKDIIEHLNQEHQNIELITVTHETYLKNHLDEYDVDIVWMSESIHQQQPFMLYDLLLHCKFKEWYLNSEPFHSFIKNFKYDNFESLAEDAQTYLNTLRENYYYSDVIIKEKVFLYTSAIRHVDINHYGFIDFGNVILK